MYATAQPTPTRPPKMQPMAKPSMQMQTLSRALQDSGGEAPLAKKLGVSLEILSSWLRGHEVIPPIMYIRARELAAVRKR